VLVLLVTNLVEDEELQLRPDVARVRDSALVQGGNRFLGYTARIARVFLSRFGVGDVGQDTDGRLLEEGVEAGRLGLRHREHVRLVDVLPAADARTVKPQPVPEGPFVDLVHGIGAVLPGAEEVAELQVDDLRADLATVFNETLGGEFLPRLEVR